MELKDLPKTVLKTPMGNLDVYFTGNMSVSARTLNVQPVEVNGVKYHFSLAFKVSENGSITTDGNLSRALSMSRVDSYKFDDSSDAARNKGVRLATQAVAEFLQTDEGKDLIIIGELVVLHNDVYRAEEDLSEVKAKFEEAKETLVQKKMALSQYSKKIKKL